MKHIRYILLSITLIAGGLAYGPASAALPAALPSSLAGVLDERGTIDQVDTQMGQIVVDDSLFYLSSSLRVYSIAGTPVSAKALKKGMSIQFAATRDDGGRPSVISNIVIISGN